MVGGSVLPLIIIMAYLIANFWPKLFRVQVQLKAENMNTWLIIKKLTSSNKKQYVYLVGMGLVTCINTIFPYTFKDNRHQNIIRLVLGVSSSLLQIFVYLFTMKLVWNVFEDVDAFLKLKGDHSFPKRVSQCRIIFINLILRPQEVTSMLRYYFEFS